MFNKMLKWMLIIMAVGIIAALLSGCAGTQKGTFQAKVINTAGQVTYTIQGDYAGEMKFDIPEVGMFDSIFNWLTGSGLLAIIVGLGAKVVQQYKQGNITKENEKRYIFAIDDFKKKNPGETQDILVKNRLMNDDIAKRYREVKGKP